MPRKHLPCASVHFRVRCILFLPYPKSLNYRKVASKNTMYFCRGHLRAKIFWQAICLHSIEVMGDGPKGKEKVKRSKTGLLYFDILRCTQTPPPLPPLLRPFPLVHDRSRCGAVWNLCYFQTGGRAISKYIFGPLVAVLKSAHYLRGLIWFVPVVCFFRCWCCCFRLLIDHRSADK